jgi:hypothetical protein
MSFIDPTYLRFVYDGLQTGAVKRENSSGLPNGLVGVYEEAFLTSTSVGHRSKLLEFFSVWALLKKEVSVVFVLPLLPEWTEEQIFECIAEYSRWFNSPVSGKYQIYHERLRTFILQRVSVGVFKRCNESIIKICRNALATKSSYEWDVYALEHLSTHLLVPAMEGLDSASLKTLAYDKAHWNRQIDTSKGYGWTKRMHNEMMLWASKYDDEQVIECSLNKVDLFHMEQSDAPRIVGLVAQNEIETALQRIESFGGNDDEGIQRKFLLYMLCLMELTLLDSKNENFCNSAIEYLLKHLSENLEAEVVSQNLNEFFPEHLLYEVIKCVEEKGLNPNTLVNLCPSIDYIDEYKNNSKFKNNSVLIENITVVCIRVYLYIDLIQKLRAVDKLKTAKNVFWHLSRTIEVIPSTFEKALNIIYISSLFNEYFLDDESFGLVTSLEECKSLLDEEQLKYIESKQSQVDSAALFELAEKFNNSYDKILVYCDLVRNRIQLIDSKNTNDIIYKATEYFSSSDLFWNKYLVLVNLLLECIIVDNFHLFYELSKSLETESIDESTGEVLERNKIFKDILSLVYLKSNSEFKNYYYSIIEYNIGVKNEFKKEKIIADVTSGYLKLNRVHFAKKVSRFSSHREIYERLNYLFHDGYINEIKEFIKDYISGNFNIKKRYELLRNISFYYHDKNHLDYYKYFWDEAITTAYNIENIYDKTLVFVDISKDLYFINDYVNSETYLHKAYQFSKSIEYDSDKLNCYIFISDFFHFIGKKSESEKVLIEASKIGMDNSLKEEKCSTLIKISSQYYKLENFEKADIYLQQALAEANDIVEDGYELFKKCNTLCIISVELARTYRLEHLYKVIDEIYNSYQYIKENIYIDWVFNSLIESYSKIIEEFIQKDKTFEAIDITNSIRSIKIKDQILKKISLEFTKKNKHQEALRVIETISNIKIQDSSYKEIGVYLISNMSYSKIITILNNIENIRIRNIIMKGVVNNLTPSNVDFETFIDELKNYVNDELTLEHILTQYFLKQLFYNNLNENTIQRFNSTLNLKWAIDINKNL